MSANFKITTCEISDKNSWVDVLQGLNLSVYFSWEYLSMLKSNYPAGIYILKIDNDDNGIITFFTKRTINQKSFDIYSPYALDGVYLWGNSDEILNVFRNYLVNNNITTYFLVSHPKYHKYTHGIFTSYRTLYKLDLTKERDILWSNLHPNHRYEINKFAVRYNRISSDKSLLKLPFLRLYQETIERVNANSSYNFTASFLASLIDSDISYALGAEINAEIECIVLFLVKNDWAEYFINASSIAGRNATRALIWESMKYFKDIGVKYINLGGGIVENDSLDQFKKRFGGEKMTLNLVKGIASIEVFENLCKEYNTSIQSTNYFPPYWSTKNYEKL